MNKSCLTCEWVMSLKYDGVMSHIWRSHISHVMSHVSHGYPAVMSRTMDVCNESCLAYEWVMSRICMSHVFHVISRVSHGYPRSPWLIWLTSIVRDIVCHEVYIDCDFAREHTGYTVCDLQLEFVTQIHCSWLGTHRTWLIHMSYMRWDE